MAGFEVTPEALQCFVSVWATPPCSRTTAS